MKRKSIKFAGMTIQDAKERLLFQLYHVYEQREAANITDLVLENLTGWKKIDRVINKALRLNRVQQEKLETYITELANHRPVQYVLGEAWFQGMPFFVNESTLIPRPETEELVEWVISDYNHESAGKELTMLDIGTGSGCIPISIKKRLPLARMISCDISKPTIDVAKRNAATMNVDVELFESDILEGRNWKNFPQVDIIISNPPYITAAEKGSMSPNVLDHEPHQALFVPDNNALVFYEAISGFAKQKLNGNGLIYFEINENLGSMVSDLLESNGFIEITLRKDLQGKDRMIRCRKPIT